ncbi:penicillin-binding protein activator [Gammaproteobacteria bacterium]|nr:penicillin-binding protein activator [Gammaproteobacteria bacterium]
MLDTKHTSTYQFVKKSAQEMRAHPCFANKSNTSDNREADLARFPYLISHQTTLDQAKAILLTGSNDYAQGDFFGGSYSENLAKLALISVHNTSETDIREQTIRFCYNSENQQYHGLSIKQIELPANPSQPTFIIGHITNINSKPNQQATTMISNAAIYFDNNMLKDANNQQIIETSTVSSADQPLTHLLQTIIQDQMVFQLVAELFEDGQLNQQAFGRLKARVHTNANLDHYEAKKSLLDKIKSVKSDLPGIDELIQKPIGDDWMDTNFQKTLKTITRTLGPQQIKQVQKLLKPDYPDHGSQQYRIQQMINDLFQQAIPKTNSKIVPITENDTFKQHHPTSQLLLWFGVSLLCLMILVYTAYYICYCQALMTNSLMLLTAFATIGLCISAYLGYQSLIAPPKIAALDTDMNQDEEKSRTFQAKAASPSESTNLLTTLMLTAAIQNIEI